jgi:Tfp pilus assembly pilus retraction ATPase PilT
MKLRELKFSDLFIHEGGMTMFKNLSGTSGLQRPPEACKEELTSLWIQVFSRNLTEWTLRHDGIPFRVSRVETEGGRWAILRRGGSDRPNLNSLGYHPGLRKRLEKLGRRGQAGLIIIAGPMGSGKTTLASALLAHYVKTYGGLGFTLENPPELNLEGPIPPNGYIMQSDLKDESYSSVHRAMRSSADYMLLGEIRNSDGARQAVRQAINGIIVITTIHSNSVASAINAIATYCSMEGSSEIAYSNLASGLLAVVHQRLVGSPPIPQPQFLLFDDDLQGARALIREKKTEQLGTEMERQRRLILQDGE